MGSIETVALEDACTTLLQAIAARRLVLLCGAGLSMAPPSQLPGATALAEKAREKHIEIVGPAGAALPTDLGDQASYFFDQKQLENYFIRKLIDRHAFSSDSPNTGHLTIADLLLTQGAEAAVSTNVDALIEAAGHELFGQTEIVLDGNQAAQTPNNLSPLLKIHGCWSHAAERSNTLWTEKQLNVEPIKSRIESSSAWLEQMLGDKALLIVGFWTDWSYLNAVLGNALGKATPSRVVVFDISDTAALEEKAPEICALSDDIPFDHVCLSGAVALEGLHVRFSQSIIRTLLRAAENEYEVQRGAKPAAEWLEPPLTTAKLLLKTRRDLLGVEPRQPMLTTSTDGVGVLVGLTLLLLQARGATFDDSYWLLDTKRVRVIHTPGEFVHNVEATYQADEPPVGGATIVICVGADDVSLPADIARFNQDPSVARPAPYAKWLTTKQANKELDL